jgi:uncharacterized membrane protein
VVIASSLAFLSALTFAASNTMLRRGVMTGTVVQAMAITVPLGAIIGWACLVIVGASWQANATGDLAIFSALAGIVHFVAGRYSNYRAIQAMGANLVAPVQQTSVVITLVLAIAILGEVPTQQQIVGIAVVLVSPLLLVRGSGRRKAGPEQAFKPDLRSGYFFATLSAFAFGVSPILIAFGLREASGVVTGLASGTIAYTAATLTVLAALALPRTRAGGLVAGRASLGWFVLSGIAVGASQLIGYMALAIAPVSVVVPIQRISIVLRLGFARAFNREAEVFGKSMLLATLLSLAGALMIAVDPAHLEALISRLFVKH